MKKYLLNYAEKDINQINLSNIYDEVIVIPIKNEYNDIIDLINNLSKLSLKINLLVILIINSNEYSETNNKFIEYLELQTNSKINNRKYSYVYYQNMNLLIVNYSYENNYFSSKYGVGLARKIGCDIALKLYFEGKIKSNFIRCTDADVILNENYFNITPNSSYSIINYPFYHVVNDNSIFSKALILYEIYLRYYYLGLKYSNSKYSFWTIGSCFAINFNAYSKVRGFPKDRKAGEDFYMINKLSKVGKVFIPQNSIVKIKCRESNRVPFGTGISTKKIYEIIVNNQEYKIYNPIVFDYLKEFIYLLDIFSNTKDFDVFSKNRLIYEFISNYKSKINNIISNSKNLNLINNFFDSFMQLKFIHYLSDTYKPINWLDALKKSKFIENIDNEDIYYIRDFLFQKSLS
ncbi:MAG: hypothetical protein KatS3mg068_0159 [Candidatus Sericytochromatia bacterium]|nr:MAG: hypothetical protein KatS3mg068_0159 [Candidatus Sericytochromatia bacterium]